MSDGTMTSEGRSTVNYRSEVAAVKRLTKTIEQSEAQAETAKWERAERLAAIRAENYSWSGIAKDTGLGATTVRSAVAVWEKYGLARTSRPRYAEADYEIVGRGPAQRPEPPAKIAERVAEDPAYARAIAAHPSASEAVTEAIVQKVEAAQRPEAPRASRALDLIVKLRSIHRAFDDIAAAVSDGQAVVDVQMEEAILEEVAWLRNGLDLIEAGIRGGSLEEALSRLLEG